ncbi:MAG: hypothetical protein QOK28_2763, partial [Actinomycetota bacterium]
ACRMLAERLVAMAGWRVEVFTTCALDATTWANSYPPGEVDIGGVRVHRFESVEGRSPDFHDFASKLLAAPEAASPADAERFLMLQGPVCPDVIDAAVASDADLLIFYPYLYYPTVMGVRAASRRAVMHPAAHDEPALRLPLFRPIFNDVQGLVFQTEAEERLCRQLFLVPRRRQHHVVLGLGVEVDHDVSDDLPVIAGLDGSPFLLCVGRVEDGKGTTMLAERFAEYKALRPGPLKLVLAGRVERAPPPHPDIVVTGAVPDATKFALLRDARALVQPSYFEAFSLSLMEAWAMGLPALVNEDCAPLREHVERSKAGLSFRDDTTFALAADKLLGDEGLRLEMGRRGRAYVEANYAWPAIIDRYTEFLTKVANRVRP